MGEGAQTQYSYLATLDGLRGIAAIVILLFHYSHFGMTGPGVRELRGLYWIRTV